MPKNENQSKSNNSSSDSAVFSDNTANQHAISGGMIGKQQKKIEQEIICYDPEILPCEATIGTFALTDPIVRRKIYGGKFPQSLLQVLYEINIRINKVGKLMFEKYMENAQKYEQNNNVRFDQPSMNLGSKTPVVTEKEQRDEIKNFGSLQQKEKESRYLIEQFANNFHSDLPDSTIYSDISPEQTIAYENFTERKCQQIKTDIISKGNLNIIYEIGALDYGRPPINDIYDRQPFETYVSGYKYDQFGNPKAYMKKPAQPISKKYNNRKRNQISTSQLIQTAKVQSDLHKKLTKSTKIDKKK
ncbi:MAG: hypothetical protein EZS28_008253 [Streblomastix strix]|uniref:Uncharacterized protein n=1 Tax=Streblomastix strix TaxID=222440 RepID=A0A5J4WQ00_9EUKA|nr:MAG: hypothetical protein EZS28_008253 [Streblomastix strix]